MVLARWYGLRTPPGTLVIQCDPSRLPGRTLGQPDNWAGVTWNAGFGYGNGYWFCGNLGFVHCRQPGIAGADLLCCGDVSWGDSGNYEYPDEWNLGVSIRCGAPPTFGTAGGPGALHNIVFLVTGLHDTLSVYVMEPDPNDPTHILIPFECNGVRGNLHAWVQPGGTLRFTCDGYPTRPGYRGAWFVPRGAATQQLLHPPYPHPPEVFTLPSAPTPVLRVPVP